MTQRQYNVSTWITVCRKIPAHGRPQNTASPVSLLLPGEKKNEKLGKFPLKSAGKDPSRGNAALTPPLPPPPVSNLLHIPRRPHDPLLPMTSGNEMPTSPPAHPPPDRNLSESAAFPSRSALLSAFPEIICSRFVVCRLRSRADEALQSPRPRSRGPFAVSNLAPPPCWQADRGANRALAVDSDSENGSSSSEPFHQPTPGNFQGVPPRLLDFPLARSETGKQPLLAAFEHQTRRSRSRRSFGEVRRCLFENVEGKK